MVAPGCWSPTRESSQGPQPCSCSFTGHSSRSGAQGGAAKPRPAAAGGEERFHVPLELRREPRGEPRFNHLGWPRAKTTKVKTPLRRERCQGSLNWPNSSSARHLGARRPPAVVALGLGSGNLGNLEAFLGSGLRLVAPGTGAGGRESLRNHLPAGEGVGWRGFTPSTGLVPLNGVFLERTWCQRAKSSLRRTERGHQSVTWRYCHFSPAREALKHSQAIAAGAAGAVLSPLPGGAVAGSSFP